MDDDRSDEALLVAHVAGEPLAFDELVRRYRDPLWAYAVRIVRDQHDAADVVQDAMLSAFRHAGRWRGEASVRTWLHRIVHHAALDRLRRRRHRSAAPLTAALDVPLRRDPIVDRERVLAVEEALGRLPLPQRAAVVLVDMEGMTVAEAAAVLEVKEGTVKSRAARGRYRLALLLGHLRPGGASAGDRSGRIGNDPGSGDVRAPGGHVRSPTGGER
ncbi:RNA polymerase sigma factor SigM [Actinomycetospora termitidis]|uniref:RNA polymerase sigma factor SigM n=1 Tax=Actinomycetospora termitidis TaxID=3053470 RepID=A0ABT7M2I1_9PSEU|nr:RNA polymerase sigma factor SigM [Actinomycetospora sp. Odt1-22]MDL5154865.1 RNA polymerase sigma factor SigM [Actinomycetospora sp. Odt1-22]